MSKIFLTVLNMSIAGGWFLVAALAARLLLKRAPKWVSVLLWALVAVRLVCPFSFESRVSLVPSAETVSPGIMMDPSPEIHTGISAVNSVVNPVISESFAPDAGASMNPLQFWVPVCAAVWGIGVAAMLIYGAVSYLRLKWRVKTAVKLDKNVFQADSVQSPFVLGLFRPKVFLPFGLSERETEFISAHERAHIRRLDHIWKPLGFLILSLHWFNPLVWLGYIVLCRDIELACDEKVVKSLDPGQKAAYSEILLCFGAGRVRIAACPLAFGEVGVNERIKHILNYKKPGFWIVCGAVAVCGVLAVCFLTNPREEPQKPEKDLLEIMNGEYSAEDAAEDGCVVLNDTQLVAGEEILMAYVNDAENGEISSVRIFQSYSGDEEFYFVTDLSFDGDKFVVEYYDKYEEDDELSYYSEEYDFLKRCPGYVSDKPMDYYILSTDPDVTVSSYLDGMISSSLAGPDKGIYRLLLCYETAEDYYRKTYYDMISADIDRDGRLEKCYIGLGQTSGVFSFDVYVFEWNGELNCEGHFVTEWYSDLYWEEDGNRLLICGKKVGSEPGIDKYLLKLKRGRLTLGNNGKPVESVDVPLSEENSSASQKAPEGFGFSFVWNTYGTSFYDSRTGELVKTNVSGKPEDYVTEMVLDPAQLDEIYGMISAMDLEAYPSSYDPFNAPDAELRKVVTPSQNVVLTVYMGDMVMKRIECKNVLYFDMSDGYDDAAQEFIELCRTICNTVYLSEEWQALPEPDILFE
ncbi:MAG: M56 family metallopeptidase [Clostridia bacterium]|nr:M56 family metallopeptidase [Clostridia bacterium]